LKEATGSVGRSPLIGLKSGFLKNRNAHMKALRNYKERG